VGICVEPVHDLAERCRLVHALNSVYVVESAVTDSEGIAKLFLGPNDDSPLGTLWPYNSINEDFACFAANGNGIAYDPERYSMVSSVTLDTLFEKWQTDRINERMDLVVIDVEGAELHVLNGFTWDRWKPTMIIIESNIHSEEIAKWFSFTDYKLLQNDGLNSIYVLELK
jgi:FkbM family methyltransferase